ncbi:uncharacterized protein CEXT_230431 [Caerostris extrusa]|uniref:Transposase IS30-like HTH domain-containing protein n=1 Tax=Caerostris extrusa TaxID=172846 RepID=A0AAV4U9L3_CAEEX|nr:uncharacterized protein CEXT_230431 [Caerostris extrusa]
MDLKGKEITPEERKIIIKLRNEGKTLREIGKIVGRTHSSIQRVINNYTSSKSIISKPRSGCPSKLTAREKRYVFKIPFMELFWHGQWWNSIHPDDRQVMAARDAPFDGRKKPFHPGSLPKFAPAVKVPEGRAAPPPPRRRAARRRRRSTSPPTASLFTYYSGRHLLRSGRALRARPQPGRRTARPQGRTSAAPPAQR